MDIPKKSVKKNFIYNTVLQIAILVVPFITTPYISRVLGADNIGKYSFSSAMVTYFTLIAALGTSTYGQRKIAFYRDDKELLSCAFWNTFVFRCIMSIISMILYTGYLFVFDRLNALNIIVACNIFDVAIGVTWFFQGVEEFKKITLRSLCVRLILLIGVFVFVKNDNDLWKYAMLMMAASVFGNLIMWVSIPKYIKKVKQIHPFDGFKEICLIFLPTIAIQIYTILDKSMIGIITKSDYANGCYEQSERIARLAITVVTSVGTVILPRVANLYHNHNLEEAKRFVYLAFRVVWMISMPIMLGLIAVSSVFIPLFLGDGFDDSIVLLCVFSFLVLAVSLAYIVGLSYLVPTNQQNIYTAAVTIAAGVNFLLNVLLIPKFSAFGAAISSVIAETVGTVIQLYYCVSKKQLNAKLIFAPSWKYIISSIAMLIALLAIKQQLNGGWASLGILVVSGVLVYSFGLLVLRDSFFLINTKKVLNRISKVFHR